MQDDFFDNNFKHLLAYHKDLAIRLKVFHADSQYQIEIDQGKDTTLCVDGRQLTSHHDRASFAKYKCKDLDLMQNITIYGYGLGDEINYILSQNPNASIDVIILNPGLMYELLAIDSEFYNNLKPNINYIIPVDDYPIYKNSVIVTPELYIDVKVLNNLKCKLINYLDDDFARNYFNSTMAPLVDKNLHDNYQLLKTIPALDKSALKTIFKDTALLLASGPSLVDNISTIKEIQKTSCTVVAVDTAISTLKEYGINPNLIVSTDPKVFDHISKNNDLDYFKDVPLIFSAHSQKQLIESFTGPKYFIFKKDELKVLDYLDKKNADFVEAYGSVLNLAAEIAVKAQCKTIKLIGADFAYKGDNSHSGRLNKHIVPSVEQKIEVLCNDGQVQKTLRNFSLYRQYLESTIKSNPSISFENYSKTGAVIVGAKKM